MYLRGDKRWRQAILVEVPRSGSLESTSRNKIDNSCCLNEGEPEPSMAGCPLTSIFIPWPPAHTHILNNQQKFKMSFSDNLKTPKLFYIYGNYCLYAVFLMLGM